MLDDLLPTAVGQLHTLALAPILYLALVAVVACAAVFSRKPSRRKAALAVLRLLVPRRRSSRPGREPPDDEPGT